jgi:AcrR family transcriptional regulator
MLNPCALSGSIEDSRTQSVGCAACASSLPQDSGLAQPRARGPGLAARARRVDALGVDHSSGRGKTLSIIYRPAGILDSMSKRQSILNSAESLIACEGSEHLTLQKVAEKAGVSKGGLLYHFGSKEELLSGLVARSLEYFERDMAAFKKDVSERPGVNTLAFLVAALEGSWAAEAGIASRLDLFASILAAFAMDPKLINPVRDAYARWQQDLETDGINPNTATIVRLAVSGLWYDEFFGFGGFSSERRQEIIEEMKRMCEPKSEHRAPEMRKKGKRKS